ncbi:aldehyde dehydrogenase (NADP(+)) [Tahibacter amnicola]|uniref:Aldehyde dehydrogenase (NADP(+)) n=1 Tax=Tahibacter amnicola TaxID=2976241 RepID=A0ABY6BBJ9_9GAMM|nr:aldehyde dehydrogenase (NADP(+)) [Tahibacter amnicola]UXI67230.1 aldehyde dehydrogenase (NADP(+)) [Tahibacter amnicola]
MSGFEIQGHSLIGAERGQPGGTTFHGVDPVTGGALSPPYHVASTAEVERACELAAAAAPVIAALSGRERAAFLRAIADQMEAGRADFERLVPLETGLPQARASGELGRTIGQLRAFAALVEEGSWVDARIDHADAARQPLPKPDVRSMLRPLGPVVVFGASNFPLAFSVAGGDTASAFAAGCPVIVKAHPAHPATGERAALAIRAAVKQCGLPEGTFSLLFDAGHDVGAALVRHPAVRAVGFTGSTAGGRALMDLAAARPDPIPVYAEMGSINPVFVLPHAATSRGTAIAQQLHGSVIQGCGQFCTSPGVILAPMDASSNLRDQLQALFGQGSAAPMLTGPIANRYAEGVKEMASVPGVDLLAGGTAVERHAVPSLLQVEAARFRDEARLHEEVFGPSTLLVHTGDVDEMLSIAGSLDGQLTATIFADPEDEAAAGRLLEVLSTVAGRVLMNGVPTGVEVCPAMVHGGPYPATSDGRTTSVGTAAIERFTRRVCYQNIPDSLLPESLRESNPLGLWRLVDGVRVKQ